jgi:hypothetical protein
MNIRSLEEIQVISNLAHFLVLEILTRMPATGLLEGKLITKLVNDAGAYMKEGDKIIINMTIRSHRTGLLLPREGIFVGAIENIGRTLLLVDFGEGHCYWSISEKQERNTFSTMRSRHKWQINNNDD